MAVRSLPRDPDLQQLKRQAKELLRRVRDGNPEALAAFADHHPRRSAATAPALADAQLVLARMFGASSWPVLAAACTLIRALRHDDLAAIRDLTASRPELAREYERDPHSGWAESMRDAASHGLAFIIATLQRAGARDADAARRSPELRPLLETVRALGRLGARFPKDAVGGAVESLAGANVAFMLEIGSPLEDDDGVWTSRVALALETYARNPAGKHQILETMVRHGVALPDTAPMAVHRGRVDLLERWRQRDPQLLARRFSHEAVFPPDLGCHADHDLALVGAPLDGATLLHIAADYEELDIVQWLLDRGADPNVRAAADSDGFGGHSALFNCVVSYNAGLRDGGIARLLLDRGADPNLRASLRKALPFARDRSTHEYRDVTPVGWARQFHDQSYVCHAVVRALVERGGVE